MNLLGARQIVKRLCCDKRLLVRFTLTSCGRSAASLAVILLIREFLGGVLADENRTSAVVADAVGVTGMLWATAGLLLGVYVLGSLCTYDNHVTQMRMIKVLELGTMEDLVRHLLRLSVPFFDRQSHGDIMQAVREDVTRLRQVVTALIDICVEGCVALGLVIATVMLSPWLALWGLVVFPLTVLPLLLLAQRTRAHSYRVRKTGYVLFDVLLQLLMGIRIIKAYRGEEAEAVRTVEQGHK
ncbi:ABC transporter transmembrane domain-containing protein [Candidatus Entotheonella palauensis]|uniref:ABC transporter transmembrane domain-containing protein n=1 Tax=Candidatus Entotheonella palauensis TaxID=93172 RepID=UPI0015C46E87|nr:ABC transporter transmembrane domain-containing protein [Candidatus Entotheonella palauensis]